MDFILKKPYEISLWDDDLVFRVRYFKNGSLLKEKEYIGSLKDFETISGTTTEIVQYYKERKICVIGSSSMNTPIRAVNPKLVSKVNGENTLTFSLYSKYWDESNEQFYDNPFLKLLVNERKIKLRYGAPGPKCKWYDLVVKNIQENSETKTFMYTAKDLFVNELSKSGFDIELDQELENNMGNITTLANTILDGSDWKLGEGNDELTQTKEEPLYEIILGQTIEARNMKKDEEIITIPINSKIYGFYTPIINQDEYFQFLYVNGEYEVDDDYVITNSKNWYLTGTTYNQSGQPSFAKSMTISSIYRGDRLVRQAQTIYDATIDKYVYSYKEGQYYGYSETEYVSPSIVKNFITQPNSFTSTSGWAVGGVKVSGETKFPELSLQGLPDIREGIRENQEYISLLKYQSDRNGQYLFNSGFYDNRLSLDGVTKNDKFVLRLKCATGIFDEGKDYPRSLNYLTASQLPNIKIGEYVLEDGVYTINNNNLLFSAETRDATNVGQNYIQVILTCKKSMSYSEMLNKRVGVFINFDNFNNPRAKIYIEDFQIFRYLQDSNNNIILPGGELKADIKTKYYYYIPNKDYKSIDDVEYVYIGYTPMLENNKEINQDYNDNEYEKVRSIKARESNRFNLIQTLCETFECWPKFEIQHNQETGEILLDENDGYRQKKFITFHEYIGKDNYAGFKYGINLKSIQRTLDSNGAVSKIIVKNNANQFAENGFCSIARARENPIKENFIYDFSYYIQQGLIDFSEVNNDLYLDINGYIGYYKKLRELNKNRDKWIEEQAGLLKDITSFEASYQTYKISVESAEEEYRSAEVDIKNLTNKYYSEWVAWYQNGTEEQKEEARKWMENSDFIAKANKLCQTKTLADQHAKLRDMANNNLEKAKNRFDELEDSLKDITTSKKVLNLQFYKKYSRFIQEGSWIKEDYVDDNLYFLDAESTLHTSSQPKVTYNINVLELSQLEGYENYSFNLGDKTHIEDTEFFGWTWKNGVKTPYKEEIVVTETTIALDSPELNSIKVQNYKTQFEDLFQRITATTQAIEYYTGEYNKVTSIVEPNGTISADTLQNSIANNAIRLENSKDQSVVWDETGITTTSASKPNEVVRLVSGGIFMSTDGGVTWTTGLTGAGINANYITSGQINTNVINIMSGKFPSFKWDGNGINAYHFSYDEFGQAQGFNYSNFVRFDQYGIYGIKGNSEFIPLNENSVWENASYALTWKGFMLKNNDGSVKITSDEDIQIFSGDQERIKIGRFIEPGDQIVYGIRISNDNGEPVMVTDDSGELWLKNRLRIGVSNNTTVEIGYLNRVREDTGIHEIFHAGKENQEFIVYEDGKMMAQGAEFHGTIYATGGQIGNLTINDVEGAVGNMNSIAAATKKLDISSKLGYNFKVEEGIGSPEALELTAISTAFSIKENNTNWYGSNDFEDWSLLAQNVETYFLTYETFKEKQLNSTYYIKAVATATDGSVYEDWATIMSISNGEKGDEPLILTITSSNGNYFRNSKGSTVLTARLFKNGREIDILAPFEYSYIWQDSNDENWSYNGKTLEVKAEDVDYSRTYVCSVSKGER